MTHQDMAAQRPLPAGIPQVLRVTATCFFTEACLMNEYQEMINTNSWQLPEKSIL